MSKWWNGECEVVRCFYLGDFDGAGCNIDRVVFGNHTAAKANFEKGRKRELDYDAYLMALCGKLEMMLDKFFDCKFDSGCPRIDYERIGITPWDVQDEKYEPFLLTVNDDTHKDTFLEDTDGDVRTLGIDALDHAELIGRTRSAIKGCIDLDAWKTQNAEYKRQRAELRGLIPATVNGDGQLR